MFGSCSTKGAAPYLRLRIVYFPKNILLEFDLLGLTVLFQRQDETKCHPTMNIGFFHLLINQVLVRNPEHDADFEQNFDSFF